MDLKCSHHTKKVIMWGDKYISNLLNDNGNHFIMYTSIKSSHFYTLKNHMYNLNIYTIFFCQSYFNKAGKINNNKQKSKYIFGIFIFPLFTWLFLC